MSMKKIAVLGVTGLVGREILKTLERRNFPVLELVALASPRSAGTKIEYAGQEIIVQAVNENSFDGVDIALFSAGGSTSKRWAPVAAKAGAIVIDNSSAWRMDDEVPLVIPEINPSDALNHKKGIIANPNCSTIQALMTIWPLHKEASVTYMNISTYQSVAGTGISAVRALEEETANFLQGRKTSDTGVYPHQIAFNLLPHIGSFDEEGISEEEWKMVHESRKIMHLPGLRVSGITVRVPIFRCHGESITVQFKNKLTPERAREVLANSPGIVVADAPQNNIYPQPIMVAEKDEVYVGRIRRDTGLDNALAMWVIGDNLLKGAALNAVQIAELFV